MSAATEYRGSAKGRYSEDKSLARKRSWNRISRVLTYAVLIIVTFLMIFPLLIVVITSFTPNALTQSWPPKVIPSAFTLDNYTSLFSRLPVGRQMLNTIVFAGAVTIFRCSSTPWLPTDSHVSTSEAGDCCSVF